MSTKSAKNTSTAKVLNIRKMKFFSSSIVYIAAIAQWYGYTIVYGDDIKNDEGIDILTFIKDENPVQKFVSQIKIKDTNEKSILDAYAANADKHDGYYKAWNPPVCSLESFFDCLRKAIKHCETDLAVRLENAKYYKIFSKHIEDAISAAMDDIAFFNTYPNIDVVKIRNQIKASNISTGKVNVGILECPVWTGDTNYIVFPIKGTLDKNYYTNPSVASGLKYINYKDNSLIFASREDAYKEGSNLQVYGA